MNDYSTNHPAIITTTDLDQLVTDADEWRTLLHACADRGLGQLTLDDLLNLLPDPARPDQADVAKWRELTAALTARGFNDMTVERIAAVFPDFRSMADKAAETALPSNPANANADPTKPLNLFLDGFLTPSHPALMLTPLGQIQRSQAVDVREFAEADTALGDVTIGYTENAQLAFTFQNSRDTYLLPVTNILSELIGLITSRRPVWTTPHRKKMTNIM